MQYFILAEILTIYMSFCLREMTVGGNRWRDARLLVSTRETRKLETET